MDCCVPCDMWGMQIRETEKIMGMNKKVVMENQHLRSLLNLSKQTEAEMTRKLSSYNRQLKRLQQDLQPEDGGLMGPRPSVLTEEGSEAGSGSRFPMPTHLEEGSFDMSESLLSSDDDDEGAGLMLPTIRPPHARGSRSPSAPERDEDSGGEEASLVSLQSTLSSVVVGRNHHGLLMRSIGVQTTYTAVRRTGTSTSAFGYISCLFHLKWPMCRTDSGVAMQGWLRRAGRPLLLSG